MVEYRERAEAERTQRSTEGSAPVHSDPVRPDQVPAYATLAADYGLPQDMYFATSNSFEQTVEEEYRSYVSGALSPQGTNILKFWEVRDH